MGALILLGILAGGGLLALLVDAFNGDDGGGVSPETPGENETIEGTEGNDLIQGAIESDTISGLAGDDTISGGEAGDLLSGDAGDDNLYGNEGSDVVLGGNGDDLLRGNQDDDLLIGGDGADTMYGDLQDDVLIGVGIDLTDVADGSLLDQTLTAIPAEDTDEGDLMNGGYGDDLLLIGSSDSATGGEGSDEFILGDWITADNAALIKDYNGDEDAIFVSYTGAAEDMALEVNDTDAGDAEILIEGRVIATVTGAAGNLTAGDINVILNSDAGTSYVGTAGDDAMNGSDGDETISGAEGADTIWASAGNDVVSGDAGDDAVAGGGGADTVDGGEGDDLVLGNWGNDLLMGGDGDDVIVDSSGKDVVDGGAGNDTITSVSDMQESDFLDAAKDETNDNGYEDELSYSNMVGGDSDLGDTIDGGAGDDVITFGVGDKVSGGEGADTFNGGQWMTTGGAHILDFDPAEDILVYNYQAPSADFEAPTVTVEYADDATETDGQAYVYVNGDLAFTMRHVGTSFTADMVTLQGYLPNDAFGADDAAAATEATTDAATDTATDSTATTDTVDSGTTDSTADVVVPA